MIILQVIGFYFAWWLIENIIQFAVLNYNRKEKLKKYDEEFDKTNPVYGDEGTIRIHDEC